MISCSLQKQMIMDQMKLPCLKGNTRNAKLPSTENAVLLYSQYTIAPSLVYHCFTDDLSIDNVC